jgi:hypothetical protein
MHRVLFKMNHIFGKFARRYTLFSIILTANACFFSFYHTCNNLYGNIENVKKIQHYFLLTVILEKAKLIFSDCILSFPTGNTLNGFKIQAN